MRGTSARGARLIFDTDVLIWFLRGNENAREKVLAGSPLMISAVTYMELVQGMRSKQELSTLRKTLERLDAEILFLDGAITANAIAYVEEYHLSHSLEMGDALIAATCVQYEKPLCTANDKHYKFIPGLELDIFRP